MGSRSSSSPACGQIKARMVQLTPADIAYQKAHIKDDRRGDIIVSHAICITLAFLAVILRFISRKLGKIKIQADDYTIIAALFFALGEVIGGFLGTFLYLSQSRFPVGKSKLTELLYQPSATAALATQSFSPIPPHSPKSSSLPRSSTTRPSPA